MTRRLLPISIAVAAAASLGISLTSCNEASCGPGTVQKQASNGTLQCVPVDVQSTDIPCDVDAGMVKIVGGQCVPVVICDPNSTMTQNGVCYGTTGGTLGCKTPAPGKACIQGTIYDFTSNTKNSVPVDAELYNATDLTTPGATPIAVGQVSADGSSFVFQDFTAPGLGLVVLGTGKSTMGMVPVGTGGQGIANNTVYTIDMFSLKASDVAGWGFDITAGGGYVAKFYSDPKPTSPTSILNMDDKTPVMGVTLFKDGADSGAKYFNATLTAIDPTLTATGTSGVAIVAAPIASGGMFSNFTGMGGGISWETFPGGSEPNFVLVTRFNPN